MDDVLPPGVLLVRPHQAAQRTHRPLLFAYLVLHLAGNLFVFAGQDAFNGYSHTLISEPLVVRAEIGLIGVFLLHVYKAVTMWLRSRAARPSDLR